MSFESFKKITFNDMKEYIEQNAPKDKAWFKKVAFSNKDGSVSDKYNHLNTVHAFCDRYMPELLPKKKEPKAKVTDILKDW